MHYSSIREIYPNGDGFFQAFSLDSYYIVKLGLIEQCSGLEAKAKFTELWVQNQQIERTLENDFNLRSGGASGLMLIFKDEDSARLALSDFNFHQACNHPRTEVKLIMNSNWRFNKCTIIHPDFTLILHDSTQPHNFRASRG